MFEPQDTISNVISSNNKKQHNPVKPENKASVPNLKTSRNEAMSDKSSRAKAKDPPNQASLNMEARL